MWTKISFLCYFTMASCRPEPPTHLSPPPLTTRDSSTNNYLPPTDEEYKSPVFKPSYEPPKSDYGIPREYGPPGERSIVTKNIYVHLAPSLQEVESTTFAPLEVPVKKKHYKIIFIKAPSLVQPTIPSIPEQNQDEHKTLIYVLVKKPSELPKLVLPEPQSTEASKPEVYFINYKQKEQNLYGPPLEK